MKTITEGAKEVRKVLVQFIKVCDTCGHPLRSVTLRIGGDGKDKIKFTYKKKERAK